MGKNLRLIVPVLVLAVVVVAVFVAAGQPKSGDCTAVYRNDEAVKISSSVIQTEVTQSKQEQQKGLSGRDCIGDNQGMLFTFEKPGFYSFWMKDMKFPIDIIWIGPDKKVVGIEKKVEPSTYPDSFINKDKPAQYVLEIQAGQTDAFGIGLDTPVDF